MKLRVDHLTPVLAPGYIYLIMVGLLPLCALIDAFVAPSIYWPNVSKIPLMAAIYGGYMLFLAQKTGPFHSAPLWSKGMRLIAELLLLYTLTSAALPLFDQMTKINQT